MARDKISELLRRIRTVQIASFLAQCLVLIVAGYFLSKSILQLESQYLWQTPVFVWITGATVVLLLLTKSLAWLISRNTRANAQELDRVYSLKERVTTYIELQETQHPFLDPLVRETSSRLQNVSAWKASRAFSVLALPVVILLFLISSSILIPYLPVPEKTIVKKEEQKGIAAKGKEMEEFIKKLEQKKLAPELKKLTSELKQLALDLQKPKTDKAEALKKINALEEKLKKLSSADQQKLAQNLKNALQDAARPDSGGNTMTAEEKAQMQQIAKDFEGALEGKEAAKGIEQQFQTEQFNSKDLKNLKEALKKYQEQKAQAEKMQAELQNTLDNARKSTSSGKGKFTADSKLKDRDVEKGKGGVEDGPGTTNQDSGPSSFDTKKKGTGEYMEDKTKAEYERQYEGQRENAGKDPLYLQSQWDENGNPQYTRVRNFGADKDSAVRGSANAASGQNQEESAVRKERVPPSHEQIVKEYFEAIEE